jgi:hypothetical protein
MNAEPCYNGLNVKVYCGSGTCANSFQHVPLHSLEYPSLNKKSIFCKESIKVEPRGPSDGGLCVTTIELESVAVF